MSDGATVEFGILGRVEVVVHGRLAPVAGVKPNQFLAVLLLSPNALVPTDRLVDALWPVGPPKSAQDNLRTYATLLRRAFGAAAIERHVRLVGSRAGYRLAIPSESLDLTRFTALMAMAWTELGGRRVQSGAIHLAHALALWRGPAGEGLPRQGWLGNLLWALDQQRLVAMEERADAWLEMGRHAELIPELVLAVAENPLRERFWRQLMLAQYRCGSIGDALNTFRWARDTFAEELGVEPGAEMARLQRAILRRDDSLFAGMPDSPVVISANEPPGIDKGVRGATWPAAFSLARGRSARSSVG